jgi:hypothetical protein
MSIAGFFWILLTRHSKIALDASPAVLTVVSSFIAISWYNTIVINVVIFMVFKRWHGLYFYSLLIASWGTVLHQLGFLMQFFGLVATFAESFAVLIAGWYAMVSSSSCSASLKLDADVSIA